MLCACLFLCVGVCEFVCVCKCVCWVYVCVRGVCVCVCVCVCVRPSEESGTRSDGKTSPFNVSGAISPGPADSTHRCDIKVADLANVAGKRNGN